MLFFGYWTRRDDWAIRSSSRPVSSPAAVCVAVVRFPARSAPRRSAIPWDDAGIVPRLLSTNNRRAVNEACYAAFPQRLVLWGGGPADVSGDRIRIHLRSFLDNFFDDSELAGLVRVGGSLWTTADGQREAECSRG